MKYGSPAARTLGLTVIALRLLSVQPSLHAAVQVHGSFSDNMVLQRETNVPVWGTAENGETVTVSFQSQTVSTAAVNGAWQVILSSLPPGGPFSMSITGSTTIQFSNILVGDVWVCGGQSNMECDLEYLPYGEDVIANSYNPMIRLCTVGVVYSSSPYTFFLATRDNRCPTVFFS